MGSINFTLTGLSSGMGNAETKLAVGKSFHQHLDECSFSDARWAAKDDWFGLFRHYTRLLDYYTTMWCCRAGAVCDTHDVGGCFDVNSADDSFFSRKRPLLSFDAEKIRNKTCTSYDNLREFLAVRLPPFASFRYPFPSLPARRLSAFCVEADLGENFVHTSSSHHHQATRREGIISCSSTVVCMIQSVHTVILFLNFRKKRNSSSKGIIEIYQSKPTSLSSWPSLTISTKNPTLCII